MHCPVEEERTMSRPLPRRFPAAALVAVASLTSLSGCSDDPSGPEGGPQWESVVEETVDATGGTVAADGISVAIPAGALDAETVLALQRATDDWAASSGWTGCRRWPRR
jgi:hypothetical protein